MRHTLCHHPVLTADPHRHRAMLERAVKDIAATVPERAACRDRCPEHHIHIAGDVRTPGHQATAQSFIAQRPSLAPGLRLVRRDGAGHQLRRSWTISSATDAPSGRGPGAGARHGIAR